MICDSYFPKGARTVLRVLKRLLLSALLVALLAAAWGTWWWHKPLTLRLPADQGVLDVLVPPGTSGAGIARALVDAGVDSPAWLLQVAWRLSGAAPRIKAGRSGGQRFVESLNLFSHLARGDVALNITLTSIHSLLALIPLPLWFLSSSSNRTAANAASTSFRGCFPSRTSSISSIGRSSRPSSILRRRSRWRDASPS